MTTATATIELPRLDNERAERYEARVTYVTMGPNRSLEAVGQRLGKSRVLMERWSTADNWVDFATTYDNQVAQLVITQATEQYRADLEDHRKRYKQVGDDLYKLARALMVRISRQLDASGGKATALKDDDVAPALRTLAGVLTTAADLEAHALRLEELLPRLTNDSE